MTAAAPQPTGPPPPPWLARTRNRPQLPPPEALKPYDEHAAALVVHVQKVETAESAAAMAWQRALGWGDVVREDRGYVREFLRRHGQLPGDDAGPLAEHPRRLEGLHVRAWRCAAWAEVAREQLVEYVRGADQLRADLSDAADAKRDELRATWVRARDAKSRRLYDEGTDLAAEWLALARVHGWALDPTKPYRPPLNDRSFPGELALLEWEADGATNGGNYRAEVPAEALRLPGAPPPAEDGTGPAPPTPIGDQGTAVSGKRWRPVQALRR